MEAKLTEITAYDLTLQLTDSERLWLRRICQKTISSNAPDAERDVALALHKALRPVKESSAIAEPPTTTQPPNYPIPRE